jgi:hypothetical protein
MAFTHQVRSDGRLKRGVGPAREGGGGDGATALGRSWPAYAAALWAGIFAVFHVAWACGWYVGLDDAQAEAALSKPWFVAYDLVVAAACAMAVPVALALGSPWGRRLPLWLVGGPAWAGTVLLLVRSAGGLFQAIYFIATGRLDILAKGIWEPWFYLGATLFTFSTWRYWRATASSAA